MLSRIFAQTGGRYTEEIGRCKGSVQESLKSAIACATPASDGTVNFVSSHLFADWIGSERTLKSLTDLTDLADETISERQCFHFEGKWPGAGSALEVWIDQDNFIVRRYIWRLTIPSKKSEPTTSVVDCRYIEANLELGHVPQIVEKFGDPLQD